MKGYLTTTEEYNMIDYVLVSSNYELLKRFILDGTMGFPICPDPFHSFFTQNFIIRNSHKDIDDNAIDILKDVVNQDFIEVNEEFVEKLPLFHLLTTKQVIDQTIFHYDHITNIEEYLINVRGTLNGNYIK